MKPVLIQTKGGVSIYATKVNDLGKLCGFRVISNSHKNDPNDLYPTLVDAENKQDNIIGVINNKN